MAVQYIYRKPGPSSAKIQQTIGNSLGAIRAADELSWDDVGRVLGKHRDRAAAYAAGAADMGVLSFLLACREWNGRFANDALALIGMKLVPLDTGEAVDRSTATCITKLLLELSVALEDGSVDDRELAGMRSALDEAGRAIDSMRERLAPRSVA